MSSIASLSSTKQKSSPFVFFRNLCTGQSAIISPTRNMIDCRPVCHFIMKGLQESFSISFSNSATGLISAHFRIAFSQHVRDVSPVWSERYFSFPLITIFSIWKTIIEMILFSFCFSNLFRQKLNLFKLNHFSLSLIIHPKLPWQK